MLNYHVKKNKRTRWTFRLLAIVILLVCTSYLVPFILGYGHLKFIGFLPCMLFSIYAVYLLIHSFRSRMYDIDYSFGMDDFKVKTHYGEKTYKYSEITNINHVVPENEMVYSLIHLNVGKDDYLIPFSYKKELADKIYTFLNERITCDMLVEESKTEE